MSTTMQDILKATRDLVAVKQAEYKSTLQGAQKKADKALENTGADDSPVTRGHALDATQPAFEPTKKPLLSSDAMTAQPPADGTGTKADLKGKNEGNETDRADKLEADDAAPVNLTKKDLLSGDANAKKADDAAAKIANDILSSIHAYQKQAAMPPQLAAALGKKDEKKVEPKKETTEPKEEDKDAAAKKQAAAPAAPAVKPAEAKKDDKQASGPQLELTTDVLAKIAAVVLSSEEGAKFVEGELAKAAGAQAAQETLAFLAEQSELAEKQAAYAQGEADAEALIQQVLVESGRQEGLKQAAAAEKNAVYAQLGEKIAQAGIEELMAAGQGAAGPGADVAPAEMGADPAAAAGAMGGGEAGGEQEITPEDLQAALEALVNEGTIQPEEAQAVMEYITSAGGGEAGAAAGAPAGAPPAPESQAEEVKEEGAGAPPPSAEHEASESKGEEKKEESKKEGAAKKPAAKPAAKSAAQPNEKVANLLEAIRQLRAERK
jgi:hypothetical protein